LLVEAKAHLDELRSSCQAKAHGGLPQIQQALATAKEEFRAPPERDWLQPYYNFCNRLAVLYYLMREGVVARLLFVYFYGDANPNVQASQNEQDWMQALEAMYQHVGVNVQAPLMARVHKLFLPVTE
jgi:hypothetical protein